MKKLVRLTAQTLRGRPRRADWVGDALNLGAIVIRFFLILGLGLPVLTCCEQVRLGTNINFTLAATFWEAVVSTNLLLTGLQYRTRFGYNHAINIFTSKWGVGCLGYLPKTSCFPSLYQMIVIPLERKTPI